MIKRYILYNFRSSFNNAVLSFPRKRETRYNLGTGFRVKHGMTANIRLRKLYILLFALCSMLYTSYLLPSNAYASAEWEVTLRVEAGTGHNQLVIGADGTATDGYDPVWEVYARLGGEIEAYFPHPEWNMVHQVFWRDIKAKSPGETTEWSFVVDLSQYKSDNRDFNIKWDLSKIPKNYKIVLIDDTTLKQIDMRSITFCSFPFYTDVRLFRVAVTVPPDITAPDPPVGLSATTLGKGRIVTLQWSSNAESDLAGYNVYRSLTSGTGYERLTKSPIKKLSYRDIVLSYRDIVLRKGKTYYYVVTAVNTSGMESGYSNEVAVTAK